MSERTSELLRWVACGVVVVAAHAAAAAIIANLPEPPEGAGAAGAITVDLAPEAVSPVQEASDLPPAPELTPSKPGEDTKQEEKVEDTPEPPTPEQVAAVEEKPEAKPTEEPQIAPTPVVPKAEVVAPPPKAVEPREKPKPKPKSRARNAGAPPPAPRYAALPAAPNPGQNVLSSAMPTWRGLVHAAIERSKRYPAEAEARGDRGTPSVWFRIDRHGRLLSSRVTSGSGSALLDQEALATLKRAAFPPAPSDIIGQQFEFTIAIRFK